MDPMNFRATAQQQEHPLAINWRWRVTEYLATIPQTDPADDLELIHMALRGEDLGTPARVHRVKMLMRSANDDNGRVTITGQIALLDVLRARAL